MTVRVRLLNLLLAALLVLAGGRLWSSLREPPPSLPAAAPEETSPEPPADAEDAPADGPGGAAEGGYDAIVARDLFSAARGVVPPVPASAAKPAPRAVPQPKLTLAGVVIVDNEKSAFLLEGTQDARPRKVREGEAFAGGTIKSIRPDGVTFLFAGNEIAIPLRTPKDTGPPPRAGEPGGGVPLPGGAQRRVVQPGVQTDASGRRVPRQLVPGAPGFGQPPNAALDADELEMDEDLFLEEGEDEFDEYEQDDLMDEDLDGAEEFDE